MKKKVSGSSIFRWSLLGLLSFLLASCVEDIGDDPSFPLTKPFEGTYQGNVTYTNTAGAVAIKKNDGMLSIEKVGKYYNFVFDEGIPAVSGANVQGLGTNYTVTIPGKKDFSGSMKLNENALTLEFFNGNLAEVWTAEVVRVP